jgi:hypothetical protein
MTSLVPLIVRLEQLKARLGVSTMLFYLRMTALTHSLARFGEAQQPMWRNVQNTVITLRIIHSFPCRHQLFRAGYGCLEDRYTHARAFEVLQLGAPGDYFLSPKTEEECELVGGVMVPYYAWKEGVWQNASAEWMKLSWCSREWKNLNSGVAPMFSRTLLANQLSSAHNKFIAQSRQMYQYCRYINIEQFAIEFYLNQICLFSLSGTIAWLMFCQKHRAPVEYQTVLALQLKKYW